MVYTVTLFIQVDIQGKVTAYVPLWATLFIIGKSITDSNLSNFLLIRFLATDPMYITYNNSVAARYLT